MLLAMDNVSHTYHGRSDNVEALRGVSLDVEPGEFIAIQGPSGCGKTTLLLTAGTLLSPQSGTVQIAGQRPYEMTPDERARFRAETIGFVFQMFHLVPYFSVLDNVLAPSLSGSTGELTSRATALLEQFGLSHRANHVPGELSSGERQRCALARALLKNPKLILADEPTGNLDARNAEVVLESLREVARDGTSVLLVTHDPAAAAAADRSIQMQDGQIVDANPPVMTTSDSDTQQM